MPRFVMPACDEVDGMRRTDSPACLTEGATARLGTEVRIDRVERAYFEALAASNARILDLPLPHAQLTCQRQERSAGTQAAAPEPWAEQADQKCTGKENE